MCHVPLYTIFYHCVYMFFLWVLKTLNKISSSLSLKCLRDLSIFVYIYNYFKNEI